MHKQRDFGFFNDDLLFSTQDQLNHESSGDVQEIKFGNPLILCLIEDFKPQRDFLYKILSAVGLQEDSINLRYYNEGDRHSLAALFRTYQTDKVLIFGDPSKIFGVNPDWAFYALFNFESGSVLCSHKLSELSQNAKFKSLLWGELKVMFNVD